MIGQFYHPDVTIGVNTGDFEFTAAAFILILLIQSVAAAEFLYGFIFFIHLAGKRAWYDFYLLLLANKRAGQFTDHQTGGTRGIFFVFCIVDPQHISGILYQSMLKAASGSNKRPIGFAGKSNRLQRSVHTIVWTAGRAPNRIIPFQYRLAAVIVQ
jgi:hypothetical protein